MNAFYSGDSCTNTFDQSHRQEEDAGDLIIGSSCLCDRIFQSNSDVLLSRGYPKFSCCTAAVLFCAGL